MDKVEIYVAAVADEARDVSGYYVLLKSGNKQKELSCRKNFTPKQRIETEAVTDAFLALKKLSDVVVYTDSRYILTYIGKYYQTAGIALKNKNLLYDCMGAMEKFDHPIKFVNADKSAVLRECSLRCDQVCA